jgi:deoxyribodipyrimidine photolyase-related protein
MAEVRALVLVLGDQLDRQSSAFDGFDAKRDVVWMAEVADESTHVWSAKQRIAVFLAAMRHFAELLRADEWRVDYTRLGDAAEPRALADELQRAIERLEPRRLVMCAPGDWRVYRSIRAVAEQARLPLDVRDDRHFFCTVRDFADHAKGRKSLRLEYFYREVRERHGVLMDEGKPLGGQWNFDPDNRGSFGQAGPGDLPPPLRFAPDTITREVIELVNTRFADHPGTLDHFGWPVTREHALQALASFITQRLPDFGRYQDALWPGEPWLYHSLLSASLNLKLLNPREVVQAAETAYHAGSAPLPSVEGFVRQILGWREYVRGLYWTQMPGYLELNALDAQQPLPDWYWTGHTDMACLHDAIAQTLAHGYAHHIQRLMVTGLYALMLGVEPKQVHAWYLAVYVDAVEWVELPNTLGMSQYADGGLMGSKPYIATGKYIERMGGGHCAQCRYDPALRDGDSACPFTTLYWDFLMRHEARLAKNPRMALQVKNLARLSAAQKQSIADRAGAIRRAEVSMAEAGRRQGPNPTRRCDGNSTAGHVTSIGSSAGTT